MYSMFFFTLCKFLTLCIFFLYVIVDTFIIISKNQIPGCKIFKILENPNLPIYQIFLIK